MLPQCKAVLVITAHSFSPFTNIKGLGIIEGERNGLEINNRIQMKR